MCLLPTVRLLVSTPEEQCTEATDEHLALTVYPMGAVLSSFVLPAWRLWDFDCLSLCFDAIRKSPVWTVLS